LGKVDPLKEKGDKQEQVSDAVKQIAEESAGGGIKQHFVVGVQEQEKHPEENQRDEVINVLNQQGRLVDIAFNDVGFEQKEAHQRNDETDHPDCYRQKNETIVVFILIPEIRKQAGRDVGKSEGGKLRIDRGNSNQHTNQPDLFLRHQLGHNQRRSKKTNDYTQVRIHRTPDCLPFNYAHLF
jgi:hypothetical protein